VDPNSFVSLVLFGLVALLVIVRGRAKRADRKRDAREAAARRSGDQGNGPALY
jgi:hypothetical protein